MKKIALIASVCFMAFTFASCSKECTCTTTLGGQVAGTSTVKTTKSCSSLDTETTTLGVVSKMTCK